MELRHLRYFIAIAEERSFTRAAERLWVAQPGLSTQIRRLESELGVQLLHRTTRTVRLTEVGEQYVQEVRAGISHLADAEEIVVGSRGMGRPVARQQDGERTRLSSTDGEPGL